MKRLAVLLALAVSATAVAQTPEQFSSNLKQRADAPNYTDIYCAGFLTPEKLSRANHVVGGLTSPHATKFTERENIYLAGGGYTVGTTYSIVRQVQDANKYEIFPGQTKMVNKAGGLYADVARVRVTYIEGEIAVAMVDFSCQPVVAGDIVVPAQQRPEVTFRPRTQPFLKFKPFSGGPSGRVLIGRDFDQFLGVGQKLYINLGSKDGLHPGDYLRITRNYDPKEMAPVDQISLDATSIEDTQKNPAKVPRSVLKKLPYHGIGEMIVLNVTETTATGMITHSLEDVQPGDVVETETQR